MRILYYPSVILPAAIALDGWGLPCRFWIKRDDISLRFGTYHSVRIGESHLNKGRFAKTASGEEVFVTGNTVKTHPIGAELHVQIVAEAHCDKHARARPVAKTPKDDANTPIGFNIFCETLPNTQKTEELSPKKNASWFLGVVDSLTNTKFTVKNGGRLHWHNTPAMTVVDIDRTGRTDKGRAIEAAHRLNSDALSDIARHAALTSTAGLLIADCVGPIATEHQKSLGKNFAKTFKQWDRRAIDSLPVSRLGIFQAALQRTYAPIHAWLESENGKITQVFWAAEQALASDRIANFEIGAPSTLEPHVSDLIATYQKALAAYYGHRLQIVPSGENFSPARRVI